MISNMKWVIVGAETGNRKDKVIPKREWVENIVKACCNARIPLYMKRNLADVWNDTLIQQFPVQMGG
jgi:protein gp37